MTFIFKIVPRALWADAQATGSFAGAPVDLHDGYIHFSAAEQVAETAARHFADQHDLLLVAYAADKLGDALRWERSRGGALFPHVYRALRVADAAWVRPLPLGADGRHAFGDLVREFSA